MGDCFGWPASLDFFCGILCKIVCQTGDIRLTLTDSWRRLRSIAEDGKKLSEKTVEECAVWPGHIQSMDPRL